MDNIKKIISDGQGYFTYLRELNKPISIKEMSL